MDHNIEQEMVYRFTIILIVYDVIICINRRKGLFLKVTVVRFLVKYFPLDYNFISFPQDYYSYMRYPLSSNTFPLDYRFPIVLLNIFRSRSGTSKRKFRL